MSAPRPLAKGWCPGVLRPMASGDGFIARVRPRGAALSFEALAMLARAADELGNGLADLTTQANIQLRGLDAAGVAELAIRLAPLGLIDTDADTEARRNIVISPLAGLDPHSLIDIRPLAQGLADALQAAPGLAGLPPKFSFLIDDGGALAMGNVSAAIRLEAVRLAGNVRFVVKRGGDAACAEVLGLCAPQQAVAAAIAVAQGAAASAGLCPAPASILQQPRAAANSDDCLTEFDCGGFRCLGALAPYGRITGAMLATLAQAVQASGQSGLRLTPWRAVLVPFAAGRSDALRTTLADAGFIVARADPRARVAACAGAPACASATADVRADAGFFSGLLHAAPGAGIALHVSGCAKGCAHPAPARVTLVASGGLYDMGERGTAQDLPVARGLTREAARARLAEIFARTEAQA